MTLVTQHADSHCTEGNLAVRLPAGIVFIALMPRLMGQA